MTVQEIIDCIKENTASFDPSTYDDVLIVQVTLSDLGEVFYTEIQDGKFNIEVGENPDSQANLIISSSDYMDMINRRLDSVKAYMLGKLKIEGDMAKAKEIGEIFG
ncbi:MAG: SCP2 sterol-binding domain-containing protein [Coriobacteriales bacterium]|jgi:putative sterol carrier protein|nr:SCP2 sterol-binding domain-containing protein [Coriobacteriales bacterium]